MNSSLPHLMKALKGFNDLENERAKGDWERLRILGTWVVSPYTKKGQHITPKKLLPLPWDEEETINRFNEYKEVFNALENG